MLKKYAQAVGIWCLILPLAILNGWLRENVLTVFGRLALPLSGVILSGCIFAVSALLLPKIKGFSPADAAAFGLLWFLLTNLFDLSSILSNGGSFADLLRTYDVTTGNLWLLVVLTAALSPALVWRLRCKKG